MKQSVEPESSSVGIFLCFSEFIERNRADCEKNEAALSFTSLRDAWSQKADTLLIAGVSAAPVISLGTPKTQLRRAKTRVQNESLLHRSMQDWLHDHAWSLGDLGIYRRNVLWIRT